MCGSLVACVANGFARQLGSFVAFRPVRYTITIFSRVERAPLPPNILHQISPERSSLFSHAPRPFVDLLSVATPTRLQCSRDSSLHSLHFHQRMPSSQNRQPSIGGSQEDTGDLWCKWKTAKNCSHGLWKCGCVLVRKAVANDLGG